MLTIEHHTYDDKTVLGGYYIMIEGAKLIDDLKELSTRTKIPFHKVCEVFKQCGARPDSAENRFYNFPTKEQAESAFIALKLMGAKC